MLEGAGGRGPGVLAPPLLLGSPAESGLTHPLVAGDGTLQ